MKSQLPLWHRLSWGCRLVMSRWILMEAWGTYQIWTEHCPSDEWKLVHISTKQDINLKYKVHVGQIWKHFIVLQVFEMKWMTTMNFNKSENVSSIRICYLLLTRRWHHHSRAVPRLFKNMWIWFVHAQLNESPCKNDCLYMYSINIYKTKFNRQAT